MYVSCRGTPFKYAAARSSPRSGPEGRTFHAADIAPCGHEKIGRLLSCEVAAPLCGDHEANCSKGHGADTPERRGCTAR